MDAGLRLGLCETFRRRPERLLSASCALDLCPVTTGNCHHFYNKTSSTEVLRFNNFGYDLSLYGKMAAIKYMKIEQNYSKCICSESISHNLQPIRNNESNIKYYWIIFTMSLLFLYKQLYNRRSKVLFVVISLIQFTIAFHSLNVFVIVSPALTQFSETLQQRNFLQLKFDVSPTKIMSFLQICTSNYSLLVKRRSAIACT